MILEMTITIPYHHSQCFVRSPVSMLSKPLYGVLCMSNHLDLVVWLLAVFYLVRLPASVKPRACTRG